MSNSSSSSIKISLKKCWEVGHNIVLVIDKLLVQRLGIDGENTRFKQEAIEGGILLQLVKPNK